MKTRERQVEHFISRVEVGGGWGAKEAAYASIAALHAFPISKEEVPASRSLVVMLSCCYATGHDRARLARQ